MMTVLEIIGTSFALVGVWLTAQRNMLCWPIGIGGVLIYIYLFFVNQLYGDSSLQFVYLMMSVYGWREWYLGNKENSVVELSNISLKTFVATLIIGTASTITFAYFLQMTDSDVVWFDAATTAFSLITTWMTAKKIVESWLYWIIIDVIYVAVLIYKELYVTSFQYLVFTLLAVYGYRVWTREAQVRMRVNMERVIV